ncbi:hypothetical protein IFM89_002433 [Coptis chinensis]|uniref:RNase H type-1 domain-containing protein n=1 Tax=Coptis chinensis TaxID=261450 RepID=A0A835ILG8_9MAGN|nr:hypothetical protein IFM89_002433 [Coptis chinensis]
MLSVIDAARRKKEVTTTPKLTGKETANSDQSEELPRKGKNRNKRRNRNKDTLAGPSGTKDPQGMHNNNPDNSEVFHDTSSELVDNNDRAYNDTSSLKAAAATDEANRVVQENAERDKVPDPLSEGQSSPIQEGEVTTLAMYNSPEVVILSRLQVKSKGTPLQGIKEVHWYPPLGSVIKCNTDGSVLGVPSRGGAGVIFRNKDLAIMGVLAVGLGDVTSFSS